MDTRATRVLLAHLKRAGIGRAVEVWCYANAETIAARYRARVGTRAAGHPVLDYVPELQDLAKQAKPLGIFPCLDIETSQPMDVGHTVAWISDHLRAE